MLTDDVPVEFDPPDPDVVWEHYLETYRRAGAQPVTRDRADELMAELSDAITRGITPPTAH
jgi:hypothetical protein